MSRRGLCLSPSLLMCWKNIRSLTDGGFDLSRLPVAAAGKAEAVSHTVEFIVGRWQRPVLPPGEYEVFLSVGEVDGTPVCELPLPGGDGARRYRIGCMQVY